MFEDLAAQGFNLRNAQLPDRPFLRTLFATARHDAPILALWPASEREAFLDQQFHFQDVHFRRFYPDADSLIVEQHGEPVGRLILDRSRQEWLIVDIAILPGSRSQGIGTSLLHAIQKASGAEASGVRLEVEILNERARKLYTRLGFVEFDRSSTHIAMTWCC